MTDRLFGIALHWVVKQASKQASCCSLKSFERLGVGVGVREGGDGKKRKILFVRYLARFFFWICHL